MAEAFVLSNFDTHIFLGAALSSGALPSGWATDAASDELKQCTDANFGKINKDTKKTKELDGFGWDTYTMLGQSADDITLTFNRPAEGVYTGTASTDNYSKLKSWFDNSIENPVGATKTIVHAKRRLNSGSVAYEGMEYQVVPINFSEADQNGDDGQSFSITLGVIGQPKPVTVTKGGTTTATWAIAFPA